MIRAAAPADEGQVAALAAALAQSFPFSPAAFAASYPALLAAPTRACWSRTPLTPRAPGRAWPATCWGSGT